MTIYDPTCGGGNLLFGVEDKIKEKYNRPTKTYGEDWSDSLYALAKIESRFRTDSEIKYGNTLTNRTFSEKEFSIVVANPPYGVDWKGYRKDIQNDQTGRFHDLPSISDGQFLFTQHIISQLASDGLSVVVHNGSTLFSGDAGSGESNIRKHFFDEDIVEAIIQLPTDEFFNTGIYTYLWIFNKNKAEERRNKVILINASEFYEPLKKSKGKKRKEMTSSEREIILKTLADFKDTDYARVFDKWHFYYNKQAIMLTNVDTEGKSVEMPDVVQSNGEVKKAPSVKLKVESIFHLDTINKENLKKLSETVITEYPEEYKNLKAYYEEYFKNFIKEFDYKDPSFSLFTKNGSCYSYDDDKESLLEMGENQEKIVLGNGKIDIKASYKKKTKAKPEHILITAEIKKDLEKDYEIIPFSPKDGENREKIADFMAKYITKPFMYLDNTTGVEINFNKVFYKPEQVRSIGEISKDLEKLELQLFNLEKEIQL